MNISPRLALGIWDGHDAGAALVQGREVLAAVNEERLTRRKLEIGFPSRSIAEVLDIAGARPGDIDVVSISTSDFAKTLTRVFPNLREQYYQLRRRKVRPGVLAGLKKRAKYRLTEWPPSAFSRAVSRRVLIKELAAAEIPTDRLLVVDHHAAHAAAACFCSSFDSCLVVTIDGIGDGLSGSFWTFQDGRLALRSTLSGRTSFGIFFEHVTNLLNMRELEDEGKVMALANFAYPVPDRDNPLLDFLTVKGSQLVAKYSSTRMFRVLKDVLWAYPAEQFAYMAQRTLEVRIVELVTNVLRETGQRNLAYAGGVASNVKVNMLLRELPEVEQLFVFPHMGDGGLALGAAMLANYYQAGIVKYALPNLYLGRGYGNEAIEGALSKEQGLRWEKCQDIVGEAADLVAGGEILLWFQGRMEFGPRALGARSILALPNSPELKDALNLRLKKRVWYQPFCPSMLAEDAAEILEGFDGVPNRFMTCAYRVRREKVPLVQGVISVDRSCRPQILDSQDEGRYAELLRRIKARIGVGVVLNTSFNLHGEPVVCSPEDALRTFVASDFSYLVLEDYLVQKK